MSRTIEYYQHHAESFIEDTRQVDMTALHRQFLSYLADGASILDAGCGSGRDSFAFHQGGYQVCAFDASEAMVNATTEYAGVETHLATFDSFSSAKKFDGIWACASLLHVPQLGLPQAMANLVTHLKPHGVIYLSFKYGSGEREHNGRRFTDMDETGLDKLIAPFTDLAVKERWLTGDQRAGRSHEQWLNAILQRV